MQHCRRTVASGPLRPDQCPSTPTNTQAHSILLIVCACPCSTLEGLTPAGPGAFAAGHTPHMLTFVTPSPTGAPAAPPAVHPKGEQTSPMSDYRCVANHSWLSNSRTSVCGWPAIFEYAAERKAVSATHHHCICLLLACADGLARVLPFACLRRTLPWFPRPSCRQPHAHAGQAEGRHRCWWGGCRARWCWAQGPQGLQGRWTLVCLGQLHTQVRRRLACLDEIVSVKRQQPSLCAKDVEAGCRGPAATPEHCATHLQLSPYG